MPVVKTELTELHRRRDLTAISVDSTRVGTATKVESPLPTITQKLGQWRDDAAE